jgi:hypothetical protein
MMYSQILALGNIEDCMALRRNENNENVVI